MSELVFLLEELSARAMLEGLLPRLLPNHVTPAEIGADVGAFTQWRRDIRSGKSIGRVAL